MKNIFDTTPFAYVGNNAYYESVSKEDLEQMKKSTIVKKEELPTSEDIEEATSDTVGEMLPQVIPETSEEPSVDDVFADSEKDPLLKECLEDVDNGAEIYLEKVDFISKIKDVINKKRGDKSSEINYDRVEKAARAYNNIKFAEARMKILLTQDPTSKEKPSYKIQQKKAIQAERDYRNLKKNLNPEEIVALNDCIKLHDSSVNANIEKEIADLKDSKKAELKKEYVEEIALVKENADYFRPEILDILITESFEDEIFTEGVNWDIHKMYKKDNKIFKQYMRNAKKYLRAKDFAKAKAEIENAVKTLKDCRDRTLAKINTINDDSKWTVICGIMLRSITIFCRDILMVLSIVLLPIVAIRAYVDNIQDTLNTAASAIKRGGFRVSDLNTYVNFVKNSYNTMISTLRKYLAKIDEYEKSYNEKQAAKNEKAVQESAIVTEKDIDTDMKPLIDKLHQKGYQTTSSSSGHNNLVRADDRNENGVKDEHLYNDARLVFKGKYNLGKAPKYWYWKKVDNADEVDYLDIEQIKYNTQPGGPSNAFQDWKRKYMKSLSDWIDSLPDANTKKEVEEACKTESCVDIDAEIDMLFESVMGGILLDLSDL